MAVQAPSSRVAYVWNGSWIGPKPLVRLAPKVALPLESEDSSRRAPVLVIARRTDCFSDVSVRDS